MLLLVLGKVLTVLQMRLLLNQKFKWQRSTRWRHTVSQSASQSFNQLVSGSVRVHEIINICNNHSSHPYGHVPIPVPTLCSLGSIYSAASSASHWGFIMFCNLCPFIVWFSTAFRLVVDQLNMARCSDCLYVSSARCPAVSVCSSWNCSWSNQQICIWLASQPFGHSAIRPAWRGAWLRSICGQQLLAFKMYLKQKFELVIALRARTRTSATARAG